MLEGVLKSLATTRLMLVKIEVMLAKLIFFEIAPEIIFGMSPTKFKILEFGIIIAREEFARVPDKPEPVVLD